jgi:hypothetical protein
MLETDSKTHIGSALGSPQPLVSLTLPFWKMGLGHVEGPVFLSRQLLMVASQPWSWGPLIPRSVTGYQEQGDRWGWKNSGDVNCRPQSSWLSAS